ncbi:uncharacterized protein LOC126319960 [Schistocerca gregaria]|uniref:uncharacterized protein LOC126319960 n=1 Tax=Schistocerca gregaria TaxID=7010 RepID=UPI00211DF4C7|nr:uncharacterized protein LOC126319960 [Schistocerca gregaria]
MRTLRTVRANSINRVIKLGSHPTSKRSPPPLFWAKHHRGRNHSLSLHALMPSPAKLWMNKSQIKPFLTKHKNEFENWWRRMPTETTLRQVLMATSINLAIQGCLGFLIPGFVIGLWGAEFNSYGIEADFMCLMSIIMCISAYFVWTTLEMSKQVQVFVLQFLTAVVAGIASWDIISLSFGYAADGTLIFQFVINVVYAYILYRHANLKSMSASN